MKHRYQYRSIKRWDWLGIRLRRPIAEPSITLLQNVCPNYRQEPFSLLCAHWGKRFEILAGRLSFDPTASTEVDLPGCLQLVENRFLFRRRLLWQRKAMRKLIASDVAILELNPRNLTTWLPLIVRRVLQRYTVVWGHAWPRDGRGANTDWLRNGMRRLADSLLVYTDTQRLELLSLMPSAKVYVAPNSLYRRNQMSAAIDGLATNIVFVGRLVPAKKPLLLLESFARAIARDLPPNYNLVFAGDGPEREQIEVILSERPILRGRVTLLGHISPSEVQHIYRTALVSVSPGYVGLSITQSFSFGVPMIVARDEPHAPEIEAAVDGVNAILVPSDAPDALADALLDVVGRSADWLGRREGIARDCAARYTVEKMVEGIIAAAEACMLPSRPGDELRHLGEANQPGADRVSDRHGP
jgi:glycosyltransferase involved in cell wall biosynthesis